MIELTVRTHAGREMAAITDQIRQAVATSGTMNGVCHVFVPHTTAAVVVNENADPDVSRDLVMAYQALVPALNFAHAEGNSDAHLLATLLGGSVALPIVDGQLRLGTWQGVFLVELDGPRTRRVWVQTA